MRRRRQRVSFQRFRAETARGTADQPDDTSIDHLHDNAAYYYSDIRPRTVDDRVSERTGLNDSDPPATGSNESAPSRRAGRSGVYLRRAGLFLIGIAPFVFFLLLLPPETTDESDTAATVAPSPSLDEVQLAFPFFESPEPLPSFEQAESSPSPSPRPVGTTVPSPAPSPPGTTIPDPANSPIPAANRFGAPPEACSNGVDDDGDGSADLADAGCSSGRDQTEIDNPACSDGLDDDGDGTVDSGDPGCSDARDRSEANDNAPPSGNSSDFPDEPGGGLGPDDPGDPFSLEGLPS